MGGYGIGQVGAEAGELCRQDGLMEQVLHRGLLQGWELVGWLDYGKGDWYQQ